jgi:hypothetical protein
VLEYGSTGVLGFKNGFTAEARRTRSKEFLIKKFSDLCELCASVVNTFFIGNPE